MNHKKFSAKQLVFSAVALALATVTSLIKPFDLPMGGSVTLFSMLFIVLIGYWYGPYIGITAGIAYGLLQFVIEPYFYSIPQFFTDYPLAFGALGLSGFFSKKKNGLIKGYIAGVLGRYFFAFLSGLLFFASYAEGSGMSAPIYSLVYNGSYLLTEAVITIIIIALPPVTNALSKMKVLAQE
ncbi:energy-coupled thiamine transporter ThiT [Roseburia sp. 499]|uniref:energy-coupled thiamine transporter ThiT n=1 Tax=Roseburia sp. 499 TaxID=1261634 RepID=UPI000951B987|nr:energy-coupled thiamine transporter ThiT [Roseburia sp. 499]WVK70181.1 energy-coupled thiamine transporter ThiT [Roseburia sp. 499]